MLKIKSQQRDYRPDVSAIESKEAETGLTEKRIRILGEKINRLEKENSDLRKRIKKLSSEKKTKCFWCCF